MGVLASESSTSLEGAGVSELEGGGADGVINGMENITTEVSLSDCNMDVATKEDNGINISRMGMKVCNYHWTQYCKYWCTVSHIYSHMHVYSALRLGSMIPGKLEASLCAIIDTTLLPDGSGVGRGGGALLLGAMLVVSLEAALGCMRGWTALIPLQWVEPGSWNTSCSSPPSMVLEMIEFVTALVQ